ncbi:MAG TPA: amidohydrolase family protein [Candidatus Xenobia bacterium]
MTPANRLGLDYEKEAARFSTLPYPIIDTHSHLHGSDSARIFQKAAHLYGIGQVYTMTPVRQVDAVRRALGDMVRFIAMPGFSAKDPVHAQGAGFVSQLRTFYRKGARVVKFWSAPRGIDWGLKAGRPDLLQINAPHRIEIMKLAQDLGMIFMAHIGDPDTWFATKYAKTEVYHPKAWHYEQFEDVLTRFPATPWIGAHMGGWPEDLEFLSSLLARYPKLYLDASATKWMVRELSRQPRATVVGFLTRWKGRIMFGSDIVASNDHLRSGGKSPGATKAGSREQAFDLYASRYWALRTLWETDYDGESPIADPDLHLVDPTRHTDMDAPRLSGKSLPPDLLRELYHDAASRLLDPLYG